MRCLMFFAFSCFEFSLDASSDGRTYELVRRQRREKSCFRRRDWRFVHLEQRLRRVSRGSFLFVLVELAACAMWRPNLSL